MNKPTLVDPRTRFKSDEFKDQEQETPALQEDMLPEPDCGEESYVGHERLLHRNALITGGDSGIGRAAAIAYAREGANVAIHYLPGEEKDVREVKALIEKEGVKCHTMAYDLRDEGAATRIVEETMEALGALDILVLNAAQQIAQTSLEDLSIEQVEDTFKVNIISMFETVKAAEKHLKPGSSIIMTTSVTATSPSPQLMDYAATKGAISNFVITLAEYFAEKGVRVNGVSPGPIWTPLQLDDGQPRGAIPEFGQKTLLGRAGQPVELAPVYVFLASNEASFVSSQIYGVTGGQPITF